MNPGGIYLGHVGRIPVYMGLDIFLLPLFVWIIAGQRSLQEFIAALIALVVAILLHELSHAAAARAFGMQGITVILGGLGGLCVYSGERRPGPELGIALAGPFSNLVLAAAIYFLPPGVLPAEGPLLAVISSLFLWNLVLGLFNLLPIYPLDGGQALRAGGMLIGRPAPVNRFTLAVSVATAIGVVVLFTWLNKGQPPLWTIFIVGMLLISAFRDLR